MVVVLLSLGMTKAEIRKQAILQRKGLSDAQVAAYSRALLEHFAALDFSSVRTVHVFLPIAEKKEPDTFLFIDWLASQHPGIRIIVPKADFETALMQHYVYAGREGLLKNAYNILEPAKGELHTGEVDMVLVPMLAFDLQGYRAGYGKGFYDRFLARLGAQRIGLSFFGPVERIDDVNTYDVKLDCCITPERVYYF
ncbi:5-formyltetrahydrofolate cyclo-ligase [Pedobacter africanus]|uniref:5-formyltetrahydrofolate cyclo-ligase n=2 Tax=Pedobacter africanus TaxID=151894 RepID=A0A1W2B8S3_9SPHI|nr:5-formyltetrahydrofolate cyclo-ligase [Pedobacter africanus]